MKTAWNMNDSQSVSVTHMDFLDRLINSRL